MKRFLALLLAMLMLATLVACGGSISSTVSESASESKSESKNESTSETSSQSAETSDPETSRWNALRTTDEKINLLIKWTFQPTINEEPTEESPTVYKAARLLTEEWLKDKPNVTVEWEYDDYDQETFVMQYSSNTGADILNQLCQFTDAMNNGYGLYLEDILESPNYYEPGNTRWIEQFPDYLWETADTYQRTLNDFDRIIGIPTALNPGQVVAIYYNKDIYDELGLKTTGDYDEYKKNLQIIKEAGYVANVPFDNLNSKLTGLGNWEANDSMWLYLCSFIKDIDVDGDGKGSMGEAVRAQYEDGFWYLENNPGLVEYYDEWLYMFKYVYESGVESIDYTQQIHDGKVANWYDGIWSLSKYYSDPNIKFNLGVMPFPIKLHSDYITVEMKQTVGPYNPLCNEAVSVMDPALQDKTDYYADYSVDWLKYMTATDNFSIQVEERGDILGGVKGCAVPNMLTDWLNQTFYSLPTGAVRFTPFDSELTSASMTALLQEYAYFMIDKETWIHNYDELMYDAIVDFLDKNAENLSEWETTYGWAADDWSSPAKPSWME